MFEISRSSSHSALEQRVERAESIDEHMTSQSIMERTYFPDYDLLDAMIASALKKGSQHARSLPEKIVSKSSALKNTTGSYEGDKLLT